MEEMRNSQQEQQPQTSAVFGRSRATCIRTHAQPHMLLPVALASILCLLSQQALGNTQRALVVCPRNDTHESFDMTSQRAVEHLQRGNTLAYDHNLHREAIAEWERASALRPDSNVPWNNMANSFGVLKEPEEALRVARKAFSIHVDYLSSTTLANVLRGRAQDCNSKVGCTWGSELYEEAEHVLLAGVDSVRHADQKHEHPFWTLAMLYWDQGDYIEFLITAKEGFDFLSREWCSPEDQGSMELEGAAGVVGVAGGDNKCRVPDFEVDVAEKIYAASMDLAHHAAGHGRFEEAREHLDWAEHMAVSYPQAKLDAAPPDFHRWCIACGEQEARGQTHSCGAPALRKCREKWRDTNGRWLRMMAVRVMGCEWRMRREDEEDFARMCASPGMQVPDVR